MSQRLTSSAQASSPKRAKLSGGGKSYHDNSEPRRGGGESKMGDDVRSKGFGGGKDRGGIIGKQIKEGRKRVQQLNGNFEKGGGNDELVKSVKKEKKGRVETVEKETTKKKQKLDPFVQKKKGKETVKTVETETSKKKQKLNPLVKKKEGNGTEKTVEKENIKRKRKCRHRRQKKEQKESGEKAHFLEKLHPFIQGKRQEYHGYPGWSADEIHWLLEQIELISTVRREGSLKCYSRYQEENKWKWVSSVLKKHSADKCKDLWVQIQKGLKPVTFKTSVDYMKKLFVRSMAKKAFRKKMKSAPNKATRTYTFCAENGNPEEMHWREIKAKLPTMTNASRAEAFAKHWQSTFEDDQEFFNYLKQHPKFFEKMCKKEYLLSQEDENPTATTGEQK